MYKISIVIINDDAEEYLDQMFQSMLQELDRQYFEIIFIDNCSNDESISKAEIYGVNIAFGFQQKVRYRGILYNKGIELANGEFILYIHSDTYFANDFFYRLKNNDTVNYTSLGFANFSQYNSEGGFINLEQLAIDFDNRKFFRNELYYRALENSGIVYYISESCFMVKKEIAQKLTFNTSYSHSYFKYEMLDKILGSGYCLWNFSECKYTHYFIEMHEKIKTEQKDRDIFLINNLHLFEMKKQLNEITRLNEYIEVKRIKEDNYILEIKELQNELNKTQNMLKEFQSLKRWKFLQKLNRAKSGFCKGI